MPNEMIIKSFKCPPYPSDFTCRRTWRRKWKEGDYFILLLTPWKIYLFWILSVIFEFSAIFWHKLFECCRAPNLFSSFRPLVLSFFQSIDTQHQLLEDLLIHDMCWACFSLISRAPNLVPSSFQTCWHFPAWPPPSPPPLAPPLVQQQQHEQQNTVPKTHTCPIRPSSLTSMEHFLTPNLCRVSSCVCRPVTWCTLRARGSRCAPKITCTRTHMYNHTYTHTNIQTYHDTHMRTHKQTDQNTSFHTTRIHIHTYIPKAYIPKYVQKISYMDTHTFAVQAHNYMRA